MRPRNAFSSAPTAIPRWREVSSRPRDSATFCQVAQAVRGSSTGSSARLLIERLWVRFPPPEFSLATTNRSDNWLVASRTTLKAAPSGSLRREWRCAHAEAAASGQERQRPPQGAIPQASDEARRHSKVPPAWTRLGREGTATPLLPRRKLRTRGPAPVPRHQPSARPRLPRPRRASRPDTLGEVSKNLAVCRGHPVLVDRPGAEHVARR